MSDFWWESEPLQLEHQGSSSSMEESLFVSALAAVTKRCKKFLSSKKRKKRRQYRGNPRHPDQSGVWRWRDDPTTKQWFLLLEDRELLNDESRVSKEFRRDFRVPFKVFRYIYDEARKAKKDNGTTLKWPPTDGLQNVNNPTQPLSVKILCALYVLGQGAPFRSCSSQSGIDEETIRSFFHEFTTWMVQSFYVDWITGPYDQELDAIVADYAGTGLPGAAGSMDCVHIPWDACPYLYRQMNEGRAGYPTRVYEVTVSHDTQIRAIAGSFCGTWNDKTVCRFDGLVRRVKHERRFLEYEYEIMNNDGTTTTHRSLWLITDNGYHHWRCLIPPMKVTSDEDEKRWSKHLEAVRKDVECTFGRLKKRFRILKIPMLYHDVRKVDNVFYTCAILHNMLLKWDGQTLLQREEQADGYGDLAVEATNNEHGVARKAGLTSQGYRHQLLHPEYDGTDLGHGGALVQFDPLTSPLAMGQVEEEPDFYPFRQMLIRHYAAWRGKRRRR